MPLPVDRLVSILCSAALVAACMPAPPVGSPAEDDHAWRIDGGPVVGAPADAAPAAGVTHFLQLNPGVARSGASACHQPVYREADAAAAEFLPREYGITPAQLGVSDGATVRIIDVACGGRAWPALGGRVLVFPGQGEFAVRNGAFFRLRRVHL